MQIRLVLRFVYSYLARFPQFVDFVRLKSTTEYKFYEGADPQQLVSLIKTGYLDADDKEFSSSDESEDTIIDIILNRNWQKLIKEQFDLNHNTRELVFNRKIPYKLVPFVRNFFQTGDR